GSLRIVALAAAVGLGTDVGACPHHAVVCRDLPPRRRHVFHGLNRRRHAEQARGSGITWSAARHLLPAVLDYVLARRGARGAGGARSLARAAGAGGAVSARVADSVMDRVRIRVDEAAALCAAALSRDSDPVGLGAGAPRPVAIMAHQG